MWHLLKHVVAYNQITKAGAILLLLFIVYRKPPPAATGDGHREGGVEMYTEFGFVKDGIKYTTIDEALESSDDS